jgi:cell division protein FtsI/penicillin-binding protein 2
MKKKTNKNKKKKRNLNFKIKINLLQLSLIISLFGIFFLLLISNIFQAKQITISEINTNQLNKHVMTYGQVTSIRTFEDSNFQIITLKDSSGEISITIDKIVNLENNQNITVIGKITEYQGELQIQANKIFSKD